MKATIAVVALGALLCLAAVSAQDDSYNPLDCVQFEGDTFKGCMHIKRFDTVDGQLVARGSCKGTNPADNSAIDRTRCYAVVETLNGVTPSSFGNRKLLQEASAAARCNILRLKLNRLFLNLLGVEVIIPRPVVVIIDAVTGANNVLGNLLCAVANLLSNPTGGLAGLIAALNALADFLNGLGLPPVAAP